MEEESSSKRKLKSLLEEVGITPSIRDIGKDMEFDIPIYENTFISGLTNASYPIMGKLPDSEMLLVDCGGVCRGHKRARTLCYAFAEVTLKAYI